MLALDTQMKDIVLASGNQGKLKELQAILSPLGFHLIPQSEFSLPTYDETGLAFIENALGKARHASHFTKLPAIADDSGLCVPVLNGAPGIYSSRYAGANATDDDNIFKLLKALENESQRQAFFYTNIVYLEFETDPTPLIAKGQLDGEVVKTPQGHEGFGYDPIFFLPKQGKTLAEISAKDKNNLSHRSKACKQLITLLKEKYA